MTYLADARLEPEHVGVKAVVARLSASSVRALDDVAGGGNNRLFRAVLEDAPEVCVKCYLTQTDDPRDRLGVEFGALRFMTSNGMARLVPRPIAADADAGVALYEWIDGVPVDTGDATKRQDDDIEALFEMVAALHRLRDLPAAAQLPPASEACLSGAELAAQIAKRRAKLAEESNEHPELVRFLAEMFDPLLRRLTDDALAAYARAGVDFDASIPKGARTLSPSDIGFHNALRKSDGRLVFLDFEYFGWDDPVKLTADLLWHPGMTLSAAERRTFVDGARALHRADETYETRLAALAPIYGLRWCLIVLNEFLPKRWLRRAYAGISQTRETTLPRQLKKAQRLAREIRDGAQPI